MRRKRSNEVLSALATSNDNIAKSLELLKVLLMNKDVNIKNTMSVLLENLLTSEKN